MPFSFALPSTAVASMGLLILEIHLATLFSEIFFFGDFFWDGTDTHTDSWTYGQTDFSRKILF